MKALTRNHGFISSSASSKRRYVSAGVFYLKRMAGAIAHFLTNDSAPRIWQTRTQTGNLCWHVYDPIRDHGVTLSSEAEVRIWLEQRYRL